MEIQLVRGDMLDTALSNGDFLLDSRSKLIQVEGYNELLQQILIRLCVKKGSFVYDRSLGSNLYKLDINSQNINNKALSIIEESLSDMPEILVKKVCTEIENRGDKLNIDILLSINGEEKDVVIKI